MQLEEVGRRGVPLGLLLSLSTALCLQPPHPELLLSPHPLGPELCSRLTVD